MPGLSGADAQSESDANFLYAARCAKQVSGVVLRRARWAAISHRLEMRAVALGLGTLTRYLRLLSTLPSEEQTLFVDCITTHQTSFFREPHHFEILEDIVRRRRRSGNAEPPRVWSAAASTGEEPYSLAMVLSHVGASSTRVRVLGTDISRVALETADRGRYDESSLETVPAHYRARFFQSGRRGPRVTSELRRSVIFRELNLIDDPFRFKHGLDVVFCRNVLIYFEPEDVARVIRKLHSVIVPGGYLFTGHSESLLGSDQAWEPIAATVYRRRGAGEMR